MMEEISIHQETSEEEEMEACARDGEDPAGRPVKKMDLIIHDSNGEEQAPANNKAVQHGKTGGCTTCDRTFRSKGRLNKHIREVHSGVTFQCKSDNQTLPILRTPRQRRGSRRWRSGSKGSPTRSCKTKT